MVEILLNHKQWNRQSGGKIKKKEEEAKWTVEMYVALLWVHSLYLPKPTTSFLGMEPMSGNNRRLVADEPVEFEK